MGLQIHRALSVLIRLKLLLAMGHVIVNAHRMPLSSNFTTWWLKVKDFMEQEVV